jgi:hypothetical protein
MPSGASATAYPSLDSREVLRCVPPLSRHADMLHRAIDLASTLRSRDAGDVPDRKTLAARRERFPPHNTASCGL